MKIKYLKLIISPIVCMATALVFSSCGPIPSATLQIEDYQLPFPIVGYNDTITHQYKLNRTFTSDYKVSWTITGLNAETIEQITARNIVLTDDGILIIAPGVPGAGDNIPPYYFAVGATIWYHQNQLNRLFLPVMFNVSKHAIPTWEGTSPNRSLIDGNSNKFGDSNNVVKVIDISSHQPDIDWDVVKKSSDVDAVLLRCGYYDEMDTQFVYNVASLNRLRIPYGVYLYSYAENEGDGTMEANTVANALATAHARLSLPIFYDLEDWATASGNAPVDPIFWKARTQEFYAQLKNRGYDENKIFCYSYPSWFDKICGEDDYLKEHLAWRASYNSVFNGDGTTYPDFNWDNFPPNKIHAWQYTSEGVFPGIYSSTTVDISAIYNYSF